MCAQQEIYLLAPQVYNITKTICTSCLTMNYSQAVLRPIHFFDGGLNMTAQGREVTRSGALALAVFQVAASGVPRMGALT